MAESAEPEPGRPPKDELADEIEELLAETDCWALTLGMIVERVDGSRRTVQDRLDILLDDEKVEYQKIGNAKAYRAKGLNQRLDLPSVFGTVCIAAAVGLFGMALQGASPSPVVFGILLAIPTGIAVYPQVRAIRERFAGRRDNVLPGLEAAYKEADR